MEAVGVASSLIAVITAAIQSTEIVYDAIGAVKNGHAAVQRLSKTINDLLQLLSLFERFAPRLESISQHDGSVTVRTLCQKILECETRMNEIQANLLAFQPKPHPKVADRLKRSGRFILKEKDLDKWQAEIQGYISLLGVYGLLQPLRNMGLANSKCQDIAHSDIKSSSQTTLANIQAMRRRWEERDFLAESHLQRIETTQRLHLQRTEVAQSDHLAKLSTAIEARFSNLAEVFAEKLTSLSVQLDDHDSKRKLQFQELAADLEKSLLFTSSWESIRREQEEAPERVKKASQSGTDDEFSTDEQCFLLPKQDREAFRNRIAQSLEKLYLHAIPSPKERHFLNFREIRDGIVEILSQISQTTQLDAGADQFCSKFQAKASMDEEHLSSSMAALRSASRFNFDEDGISRCRTSSVLAGDISEADLDRSHNITTHPLFVRNTKAAIGGSPGVRNVLRGGISHERECTSRSPTSPICPILIQQNLRNRKVPSAAANQQRICEQQESLRPGECLPAQYARFRVRNSVSSFMGDGGQVIIQFHHQQHDQTYRCPAAQHEQDGETPKNIFRTRIVLIPPRHSAFKGQTIALEARKPQLVKLLIDKGAEVDVVEPDTWVKYRRMPRPIIDYVPFAFTLDTYSKGHTNETISAEECYRVMLRAGADPAQSEEDSVFKELSSFAEVLLCARPGMVADMLNLGAPFVSPNYRAKSSTTPYPVPPVVLLGIGFNSELNDRTAAATGVPAKIIVLIKRGVDLSAVDSKGNTCLHKFLASTFRTKDIHQPMWLHAYEYYSTRSRHVLQHMRRLELRDVLMLLVTAGASVTSVNHRNKSVCDVAQSHGNEVLWKDVLEECGMDVEKVYSTRATDIALSTSVSRGHRFAQCLAPNLTFEEYLKRREANHMLRKSDRIRTCQSLRSFGGYDDESDEEYSEWSKEIASDNDNKHRINEAEDGTRWTTENNETQSCDEDQNRTPARDTTNDANTNHAEHGTNVAEQGRNDTDDLGVDAVFQEDQQYDSRCWNFEIDAFSDNCAEDNNDILDDATWPARLNDDWGNTHPAKTIDHSLAHDFKGPARQPDKGKKKAD